MSSPIGSAEFVGDLVDVVSVYRASRLNRQPRGVRANRDATRVKVKNSSGADRAIGEVLEVGALLLSEVGNEYIWHDADTPTAAAGKVVGVLLEPIKSNEIGEALLVGACKATVNMQTEGDAYCSVEASSHKLKSGPSGEFSILHATTGTGDQECIVLLDSKGASFEIVHIKLTEVLHPGASALGRLVEWSEDDEDWLDLDEDADDVLLSDVPFMVPVSGEDPIRSGWNFGLIGEVFQARPAAGFLATTETPDPPLAVTYETIGSWGLVRQATVKAPSSPLLPTEEGQVTIYVDGVDDVDLDVAVAYGPASPWFDAEKVTVEFHREVGEWFIRPWARRRMRGTSDGTIPYSSSGTVDLSNGESVTAFLNWMAGTTNLATGKECIVEWFEDEGGTGAWVITGAAC